MQTQCPTCQGKGEITIHFEKGEGERWGKYDGDLDLWEKYSHAAFIQEDGNFSAFQKIASFYRYGNDFAINFWHSSWPCISREDLKKKFLFIERRTGKQVTFEEPEKKPFKETVLAMLNADPSFQFDHVLVTKVSRLGFDVSPNQIQAVFEEWKSSRTTL